MRRRMAASEAGFTLIEVMVAALILVVAFTALATVFINGQNQGSADVQESQLINVADQQIEQIRADVSSQGFSALGMAGSPVVLSTAAVRSTWSDPDHFLVGTSPTCYIVANNYDSINTAATTPYGASPPAGFVQWSTCGSSSNAEPLVTLTGSPIISWSSTVSQCGSSANGQISVPCWTPLTSGCTTTATSVAAIPACAATVYAFVTDTYVGCGTSGGTSCPTPSSGVLACTPSSTTLPLPSSTSGSTPCGDARRLTVAVVANTTQKLARVTPLYLSSVFTNPTPSGSNSNTAGVTLNLQL